ncbi:PREDICTED: uncharacterized protein LOC108754110 [Trachymyrmex septentrionalis]|uniref:uncharacterized protein LOC108754110 n=1 Tax=Trachymyrmex septentrionalis TaxID=34720 RepID=UPI00084F14E8|nr:PREDICTED: uncharacterized protein LOC108754110 [Trachymyrmex septentrionalis]
MTRLSCTIWALVLNSLKIPIFQTCFANALEDEFGYPLISSPSTTSFLIATSVYIIIVNSTLFPKSFREPKPIFMCLYEFLVTAFFLEFAIACIWTPIDVVILSTLPKKICPILNRLKLGNVAEMFSVFGTIKLFTTILINGIATMVFLITLHVTRAVNFKDLTDNGVMYFLLHMGTKFWQRMWSEFSEVKKNKEDRYRYIKRRNSRSKNRADNRRR